MSIPKLQKQIEAHRQARDRLTGDLAAAHASINAADASLPALEEARAERRQILARAMVSKKTADTKSLDAKIQNLEAQHQAAQAVADTAKDALAIIASGIAIAENDIEESTQQVKQTVSTALISEYESGLDDLVGAFNGPAKAAVERIVSAQRAWDHAARTLGLGKFPGRAQEIIDGIRAGVKVPWQGSRLADPAIAAEYTADYKDYLYAPGWADELSPGFADEQVAKLVGDLRSSGIECAEFRPYQPDTPEKMLKVRIKRGSIQSNPKVKRSPATHSIVDRTPVTYSMGEDMMLDEATARRLRWDGSPGKMGCSVLIYGEDAMDEPVPDEETPRRIEMVKPDQPRVTAIDPQGRGDGYRGFSHNLDLSSYPESDDRG